MNVFLIYGGLAYAIAHFAFGAKESTAIFVGLGTGTFFLLNGKISIGNE